MATAVKLGMVPAAPRTARLLTPKEASELLGIPEGTLAQWRSQKRGPAFVKLEGRLVRYRAGDLESYVTARIVETEFSVANDNA